DEIAAGVFVQAVHVLCDDSADHAQLLEARERGVPRIGLHVRPHERLPLDGLTPPFLAVLGVPYVVLDGELRGVVALPEAARPPEVGDARLRRNAGTREGDAGACLRGPLRDALDLVVHSRAGE